MKVNKTKIRGKRKRKQSLKKKPLESKRLSFEDQLFYRTVPLSYIRGPVQHGN